MQKRLLLSIVGKPGSRVPSHNQGQKAVSLQIIFAGRVYVVTRQLCQRSGVWKLRSILHSSLRSARRHAVSGELAFWSHGQLEPSMAVNMRIGAEEGRQREVEGLSLQLFVYMCLWRAEPFSRYLPGSMSTEICAREEGRSTSCAKCFRKVEADTPRTNAAAATTCRRLTQSSRALCARPVSAMIRRERH